MSSEGNPPTAKLQDHSAGTPSAPAVPKPDPAKAPATLEEDDEFEDFPVEDWGNDETEGAAQAAAGDGNAHLWEESWDDDDDASEEFSKQLKEELEKVKSGK